VYTNAGVRTRNGHGSARTVERKRGSLKGIIEKSMADPAVRMVWRSLMRGKEERGIIPLIATFHQRNALNVTEKSNHFQQRGKTTSHHLQHTSRTIEAMRLQN
jgi:hypothetical protein